MTDGEPKCTMAFEHATLPLSCLPAFKLSQSHVQPTDCSREICSRSQPAVRAKSQSHYKRTLIDWLTFKIYTHWQPLLLRFYFWSTFAWPTFTCFERQKVNMTFLSHRRVQVVLDWNFNSKNDVTLPPEMSRIATRSLLRYSHVLAGLKAIN